MKKIILSFGLLILAACGRDDDKTCDCTQQRWERKVIREASGSNQTISTEDWKKVGLEEKINIKDCNQNGVIGSSGDTNSNYNPETNTYSVTEYEYRITCK